MKIPRETTKTKDITGGLPRVQELFEARTPREPAIITEIDGVVHLGDIVKGMRQVSVESDAGETREYLIPRYIHVNVQEGEVVEAGDALIDGPINPHDVLQVLGEKELQRYLTDKIQEVYRSQSVAINDKHIEVIVRQMMRSVQIEEVGDTDFLIDEQVDRWRFKKENKRVLEADGQPAIGHEYFDSREALLAALIHEGFDELKQAFVSVPAALPPRERLAALGLAYIEFARQRPETFALLFTQHTTRHTQLSEVQHGENFYAVFRAAVVAILAKAPARQIDYATYSFWALVHGLAMLQITFLQHFDANFPHLDPTIIATFITGLGQQPS